MTKKNGCDVSGTSPKCKVHMAQVCTFNPDKTSHCIWRRVHEICSNMAAIYDSIEIDREGRCDDEEEQQ